MMSLSRVKATSILILSLFALCFIVLFIFHLRTDMNSETPSISGLRYQFQPQKECISVTDTSDNNNNNHNIIRKESTTSHTSVHIPSSTADDKYSIFDSFSWESFFDGNDTARTDLLSRLSHHVLTTTPYLTYTTIPDIIYDCTNPKYAHLLTGKVAATPHRILDFFGLLSELDVLTVRLYELAGLVDQHIIYESTRSHRGKLKPLYYHTVASRYAHFHDVIVHMVEDDTLHLAGKLEDCPLTRTECWAINSLIWKTAIAKYRIMYPEMDMSNTLVITGDIDEIPSREAITHIKYCEIVSERFPIAGSSIMYMYSFDWMFRSDWPSQMHGGQSQAVDPTYTLRFPTINLLSTVMANGNLGRVAGYQPSQIRSWLPLGEGCHISDFGGLPFLLQKYISSNEAGFDKLHSMRELLLARNYTELERIIYAAELNSHRRARIIPAQSHHFIPWIVKKNKHAWKYMIRRLEESD